ncbi:MAG: rhodanese-like domain-containing protein [Vallitaleaceae bacterium]|nr:rhodanese-like domain-containing protein [Vallitaleaceae bacterium]
MELQKKHKKWIVLTTLLLLCTLSTIFYIQKMDADSRPRYQILYDVEDLTTLLLDKQYFSEENESEEVYFIDLRDREDYEKKHITNTINIPFDDEGDKLLSYLTKHKAFDREIILMCYSGKRSSKAFNLLVQQGFKDLTYLPFGYEEYATSGMEDFFFQTGKCKCEEEE